MIQLRVVLNVAVSYENKEEKSSSCISVGYNLNQQEFVGEEVGYAPLSITAMKKKHWRKNTYPNFLLPASKEGEEMKRESESQALSSSSILVGLCTLIFSDSLVESRGRPLRLWARLFLRKQWIKICSLHAICNELYDVLRFSGCFVCS